MYLGKFVLATAHAQPRHKLIASLRITARHVDRAYPQAIRALEVLQALHATAPTQTSALPSLCA